MNTNIHRRREGSEMNLQLSVAIQSHAVANRPHTDRDHDLVEALRLREPSGAETLVTRYGERAYRLASRITGNTHDAEEVVQDAFLTVIRKIDTFRAESAFGSWLYRIVANAAYQKLRGRPYRRHDISLDEVLPLLDEAGRHVTPAVDWSPRVDDPSIQVELRTALTAAIDELPAAYRVALVLRDVEGRSNAEIADALGLNVGVVKTRVHRARLFLRKRLTDCMPGLEAAVPA
jgi:RNA polymerase sigma-70 factor, ECF subfamily